MRNLINILLLVLGVTLVMVILFWVLMWYT